MQAVTRAQMGDLVASFSVNTDWGSLDGKKLQDEVNALPREELGRRFTLFMQNGMNFVMKGPGQLIIDRSKPFDPAKFISSDWSIWRGPKDGKGLAGDEEQDARSLALTEIDFASVLFTACLNEGETTITGEQKLERHIAAEHIRFDAKIGQCLLEEKGQVTLEWLYNTFGITWFELPGTTLRNSDGRRCFLYLGRDAYGRWRWRCYWLVNDRNAASRSAVRAK